MQRIRIQIAGPGQGPGRPPGLLARILFGVAAVAALVVAAFLGAFFFLAALGFFLVASVVLAVRVWWAGRRLEKARRDGAPRSGRSAAGERPGVIEGEYRVVGEKDRPPDGDDGTAGGDR